MKDIFRVIKTLYVNGNEIYNDCSLHYQNNDKDKDEKTYNDLMTFLSYCKEVSEYFDTKVGWFSGKRYLTFYGLKIISNKNFKEGKICTRNVKVDSENFSYNDLIKMLPAKEFLEWQKDMMKGKTLNG